MKRGCVLVCVLCLLVVGASASVETEERLTPLSNKTLQMLLHKNGYKGWMLYQPGASETDTDTSAKGLLKHIDLYPVVAVKAGETHLIILQKKKSGWEIQGVNPAALTREGFRLYGFSMDENVGSGEDPLSFCFDFADGADRGYTLCLELSRRFPSCFRSLRLPMEETAQGVVVRQIVMNYDRDFDFELDVFGGAYRQIIGVSSWQRHEFGVEVFSLANMPLSLHDLTKPATVTAAEGAKLYRAPLEQGAPLRVLQAGDAVSVVHLAYGQDAWMIVWMAGEVYFARSGLFTLD